MEAVYLLIGILAETRMLVTGDKEHILIFAEDSSELVALRTDAARGLNGAVPNVGQAVSVGEGLMAEDEYGLAAAALRRKLGAMRAARG